MKCFINTKDNFYDFLNKTSEIYGNIITIDEEKEGDLWEAERECFITYLKKDYSEDLFEVMDEWFGVRSFCLGVVSKKICTFDLIKKIYEYLFNNQFVCYVEINLVFDEWEEYSISGDIHRCVVSKEGIFSEFNYIRYIELISCVENSLEENIDKIKCIATFENRERDIKEYECKFQRDTQKIKDSFFVCSIGDLNMDYIGNPKIKKLEISEGVTNLRENAFSFCKNLEEVILPQSLKEIPRRLFFRCEKLRKITFNKTLQIIGAEAFSYCLNLDFIILPNSITRIEFSAFRGCRNLKKIVLPSNLESIPESCFQFCSNLSKIKIPSSVIEIKNDCFHYCGKLKKINLPANLKVIQKDVFSLCVALKKVVLPVDLQKICDGAFSYCSMLKKIVVPENVVEIGSGAFKRCKSLKKITIPQTLAEISTELFSQSSINNIVLPKNLKVLKKMAFNMCNNLFSIDLSTTKIRTIEECVFQYCENLKQIKFNDEIENICDRAFYGDHNLEVIDLSNTRLKRIANDVFSSCGNLKKIIFPKTLEEMGEDLFYDSENLDEIVIPSTVKVDREKWKLNLKCKILFSA